MKDINLIDSCQAHLPVQYASNIQLIRQKWHWCSDWQRATPACLLHWLSVFTLADPDQLAWVSNFFSHVQPFSGLYQHNAVSPESLNQGPLNLKSNTAILPSLSWVSVYYLSGTGAITNTSVSHLEGDISRFQRMSSIDSFNQRSHPNEMLTGLRYFERANKGDNGTISKVKKALFYMAMITIYIAKWGKFSW